VIPRFACGLTTVVTADAVAGNTAVVEGGTGEAVGIVAIFTAIGTRWVVGRFTQGDGTVMTADTGALYLGVIDSGYRRPPTWCMAGFAGVGAGNVITGFPGGLTSVMAADAVTGNTAVVEGRAGEAVGVVAILTVVRTLRVISCFTQRDGAVMAANAGTLHLSMVDPGYR